MEYEKYFPMIFRVNAWNTVFHFNSFFPPSNSPEINMIFQFSSNFNKSS